MLPNFTRLALRPNPQLVAIDDKLDGALLVGAQDSDIVQAPQALQDGRFGMSKLEQYHLSPGVYVAGEHEFRFVP
jgi:hypothetical protein